MDIEQFWNLIEQAGGRAAGSIEVEDIAHRATVRAATQEPHTIAARLPRIA